MSEDAAQRYHRLRDAIDRELRDCGREPGGVTLVGVGKGQPSEVLRASIEAGLHDLGENYLQEARRKFPSLPPVRKHFVGHIQTNKARQIAATFDVVQSVDRLEAGAALARAAREAGRVLRVLVQVNVSPAERFGTAPADAPNLAERLRAEGLHVDGVMAIGPLDGDVDAAFERARRCFERVGGSTLSLGMSSDWESAVRHGSTMVRLGTAIFGPRPARERN